ncbi:MAG TPA: ATP synthase F1 subunit delta [Nitrospinota bacterium]|nr:ATP synthase F1 subunit delta [Nitrospinota bacterium]
MKETAVARRYARAFAELYSDPAILEQMMAELSEFATIFEENKELRTIMLNPAISQQDKSAVMAGVLECLKVAEQTTKLIELLVERNRIGIIRFVSSEFNDIAFVVLGRVSVEVTTAVELTDSEMKELSNKLTKLVGKEAVITAKIDPSLIGGVVARIGSVLYDGSILNHLRTLRVALN